MHVGLTWFRERGWEKTHEIKYLLNRFAHGQSIKLTKGQQSRESAIHLRRGSEEKDFDGGKGKKKALLASHDCDSSQKKCKIPTTIIAHIVLD